MALKSVLPFAHALSLTTNGASYLADSFILVLISPVPHASLVKRSTVLASLTARSNRLQPQETVCSYSCLRNPRLIIQRLFRTCAMQTPLPRFRCLLELVSWRKVSAPLRMEWSNPKVLFIVQILLKAVIFLY